MVSPCIRSCRLENDLCQGCHRSVSEIRNWTKMSEEERKQIMENLENVHG